MFALRRSLRKGSSLNAPIKSHSPHGEGAGALFERGNGGATVDAWVQTGLVMAEPLVRPVLY